MKVFVVGYSTNYSNFIDGAVLTKSLEEADVVLFTGGEDVDPSLYGAKKHRATSSNLDRDLEERAIFGKVKPKQLCLGICRGSQFLCVMNGGILVQHCIGHAIGRTHVITNGEEKYHITSTHHQMQYPFVLDSKDYDMLFWSSGVLFSPPEGDGIDPRLVISKGDPEIVLYHKEGLPKCLAVQGHPEMIPNSPVAKMISNLINKLVNENR